MKKVIQDLWIQRAEGIMIFSRVFHESMQAQLFGALMSALNMFAKEISESGGLSNFEISDIRFTIIKRDNLLFIANSAKKIKEKKVILELENIAKIFLSMYPETNEPTWSGDLNKYESFEKEIEGHLEDKVKKFWSDF